MDKLYYFLFIASAFSILGYTIKPAFEILNANLEHQLDKNCPSIPCKINLQANYQGADSYVWDLGDGSIYYDNAINHIYTSHGIYAIELKVTLKEEIVDTIFQIEVLPNTFDDKEYELGLNGFGQDIVQCNDLVVLFKFENEAKILFIDESSGSEITRFGLNTKEYNLRSIHCTKNNYLVAAMSKRNQIATSQPHSLFIKFNKNGDIFTDTINFKLATTQIAGSDNNPKSIVEISDTFLNNDDELMYTGTIFFNDSIQPTYGKINTTDGTLMTYETYYEGCGETIQCAGRRIIGNSDDYIYTLNLNKISTQNNFFLTRITDYGDIGLTLGSLKSDIDNLDIELIPYNNGAILLSNNSSGNLYFEIYREGSLLGMQEYKIDDAITTFYRPTAKVNNKEQLVIVLKNSLSKNSNGVLNLRIYDLTTLELVTSVVYDNKLIEENEPIGLENTKEGGYIIMANDVNGKLILIKTDSQGKVWK